MEREIKFRVFDEQNKTMCTVNSIWGFPIVEHITVPHKDTVNTLFYNFKLMQFTGRKDDNDTDLFDGDIVLFPVNDQILSVEFNDDKFKFQFSDGSDINDGERYGQTIFIIGNIHENPELLTPKTL